MLYHILIYTGITRGKKLVVLVGSKKAIAMAVKNYGAFGSDAEGVIFGIKCSSIEAQLVVGFVA